MTAERVFVALGANLGDPPRQLAGAVRALEELGAFDLIAVSSWHRTAPVGGPPGQPDYLNGVLEGRWGGAPEALLDALQAIETRFGRDRACEGPSGARTLDLDLLLFGERRLDTARLVLPHPRLEQRRFVLAPLAEIAPDLVLPGCGRTAAERLAELEAAVSRA